MKANLNKIITEGKLTGSDISPSGDIVYFFVLNNKNYYVEVGEVY